MAEHIDEMGLQEHELRIPLQPEDLARLKIGDVVYLSGLIFTGRVRFYQWVLEQGHVPPVDIGSTCNVNFHCSPAVSEVRPGEYLISSVTGTASFRFGKWMKPMLAEHGVRAIIGKGGMHPQLYRSVFRAYGAVYLTTVGYGLGARYGRSIRRVANAFWVEELGMAQAMWIIDVQSMGPFIVDCDVAGNSLQAAARAEIDHVFRPLRDSFPALTLKRFGEVDGLDEEPF